MDHLLVRVKTCARSLPKRILSVLLSPTLYMRELVLSNTEMKRTGMSSLRSGMVSMMKTVDSHVGKGGPYGVQVKRDNDFQTDFHVQAMEAAIEGQTAYRSGVLSDKEK